MKKVYIISAIGACCIVGMLIFRNARYRFPIEQDEIAEVIITNTYEGKEKHIDEEIYLAKINTFFENLIKTGKKFPLEDDGVTVFDFEFKMNDGTTENLRLWHNGSFYMIKWREKNISLIARASIYDLWVNIPLY